MNRELDDKRREKQYGFKNQDVQQKKGCGMIVNKTTLDKPETNDTEINNRIGNRIASNNEQSPHRIVSYKRFRNGKCTTIQTRKLTA